MLEILTPTRHMTLDHAYDLGCDWFLEHDVDAPFPQAEFDRLKQERGETLAAEFRRGWSEGKGVVSENALQ